MEHTFHGKWISNEIFANLRARNVFHRQLEKVSLDCSEYRNQHVLFRKSFETAIRAVHPNLKASSLALGATHMQTIFHVILPAAKSGIFAAIMLGVGRAIGEAMAITLVSGSSVNLPLPFNSVRFLTTALVSEMGYASDLHREVLFTIGLVLFVFIMIINILMDKIIRNGGKTDA